MSEAPAVNESPLRPSIARLAALIDRLRPPSGSAAQEGNTRMMAEVERLQATQEEAQLLHADLQSLLSLPRNSAFYAETGVRSALGFLLELTQRLSHRVLPPLRSEQQLRDVLHLIFREHDDQEWVEAIEDRHWCALMRALGFADAASLSPKSPAASNLLDALGMLSYRLAGAALDRELLRADPSLERNDSPFLAQNAALLPLLARARSGGAMPLPGEVHHVDTLLSECEVALVWVRHRAREQGVSVRLTYLLARLAQLISRQRALLELLADSVPLRRAVPLFKRLLAAEQSRQEIGRFIADTIGLLARNVTDHASRHGEHYIAETRSQWWAMGRSAAGGGLIIALMALLKLQLGALHLPPLTEGIAFGLNYGLGFVLIHLLGFTVATKQPAMTAASIAATLEEAAPRDFARLAALAKNVVRTQAIAVLGNVAVAFPLACLIAALWPWIFGQPLTTPEKTQALLADLHPFASGALFYAAVAGIGLFLSGLVSGFFDNRARYHQLAARVAAAPRLAWLGKDRAERLAAYLDAHYGAILGNLFFGMYLGLVGVFGKLTGIPIDIRHVAFSSANVGTALLSAESLTPLAPFFWAAAGVLAIALVNLAVSFGLALTVAMRSRGIGSWQAMRLGRLLARDFAARPLSFFAPPEKDRE